MLNFISPPAIAVTYAARPCTTDVPWHIRRMIECFLGWNTIVHAAYHLQGSTKGLAYLMTSRSLQFKAALPPTWDACTAHWTGTYNAATTWDISATQSSVHGKPFSRQLYVHTLRSRHFKRGLWSIVGYNNGNCCNCMHGVTNFADMALINNCHSKSCINTMIPVQSNNFWTPATHHMVPASFSSTIDPHRFFSS